MIVSRWRFCFSNDHVSSYFAFLVFLTIVLWIYIDYIIRDGVGFADLAGFNLLTLNILKINIEYLFYLNDYFSAPKNFCLKWSFDFCPWEIVVVSIRIHQYYEIFELITLSKFLVITKQPGGLDFAPRAWIIKYFNLKWIYLGNLIVKRKQESWYRGVNSKIYY